MTTQQKANSQIVASIAISKVKKMVNMDMNPTDFHPSNPDFVLHQINEEHSPPTTTIEQITNEHEPNCLLRDNFSRYWTTYKSGLTNKRRTQLASAKEPLWRETSPPVSKTRS